jgi:hypothetical protein
MALPVTRGAGSHAAYAAHDLSRLSCVFQIEISVPVSPAIADTQNNFDDCLQVI